MAVSWSGRGGEERGEEGMVEVGSSGEGRGRKGGEGRREERRDGRGGKGRGGMGLETKGGMGRGRDLLPVPNMCLWACTGQRVSGVPDVLAITECHLHSCDANHHPQQLTPLLVCTGTCIPPVPPTPHRTRATRTGVWMHIRTYTHA